jgi:CheY-like chemotaxis protein
MAYVIVADNDVMIRSLLRSLLEGMGQTVILATCGEETMVLASQVQAGLVMLDLNMPRLNGFLTCERLRRLPGYETTPIVILSAHEGERERHAAALVGTTLFLAKPFQPAVLLQALSPYLDIDVRTRKAISHGATRAREIAPLVGSAFERDGGFIERDRVF